MTIGYCSETLKKWAGKEKTHRRLRKTSHRERNGFLITNNATVPVGQEK